MFSHSPFPFQGALTAADVAQQTNTSSSSSAARRSLWGSKQSKKNRARGGTKKWRWTVLSSSSSSSSSLEGLMFAASSETERTTWVRAMSKAIHNDGGDGDGTGGIGGIGGMGGIDGIGGGNGRRESWAKQQAETTDVAQSLAGMKIQQGGGKKNAKNSAASNAFDLHLNNLLSQNNNIGGGGSDSGGGGSRSSPDVASPQPVLKRPVIPRGKRRTPGKRNRLPFSAGR
jgi:hypothetical protein